MPTVSNTINLVFTSSPPSDRSATFTGRRALLSKLRLSETELELPIHPHIDLASAVFLGRSQKVSTLLGEDHPTLQTGDVHPSHLMTLHGLAHVFAHGRPQIDDNLTLHRLSSTIAVVGGPVASLHSRFLLGTGDISPLLGIIPPVRFQITNYYSHDYNSPKRASIIIGDHSSEREHMLITSIPISDTERLFNIAGLRAYDATSIKFLFSETGEGILTNLYKKTVNIPAWQAIFHVIVDIHGVPVDLSPDFYVFEINTDIDRITTMGPDAVFLSDSDKQRLSSLLTVAKPQNKERVPADTPVYTTMTEDKNIDKLRKYMDEIDSFVDPYDQDRLSPSVKKMDIALSRLTPERVRKTFQKYKIQNG